MTYKQAIKEQCERYAKDERVKFIGYNTVFGSRMYGTLSDVPVSSCIESPIAENLMVGMAVGMALEGYLPVVCFERHDFLLLAMDALINHVDKLAYVSGQQFKLPIIIRAIVGGSKLINPGPMHTQNHTMTLTAALKNTPVFEPITVKEIEEAWNGKGYNKCKDNRPIPQKNQSGAIVIVERKDLYEAEISP